MVSLLTTRILSNDKLREATFEEAEEAVETDDDATVWVDVVGRTSEELHHLQECFSLHPLAVEDALRAHQRPKLDDYGSHLFVVFYGLGDTPEEEDDEEFDVFICPKVLITVRDGTTTDLGPVLRRLEADCPPGARAGYLAWALMDEVVDRYFTVVDALEEEIDDLEERVFETPPPQGLQARIFNARKMVIRLRRRVTPMRDILNAMIKRPEISQAVVPYLQDVYDHVLRITDTVDTFRDLISSAHDSYLTEVSNEMNRVMKRFTSWGAILFVSTLIAGIYGMNFEHMPELNWIFGYPMALTLMALATIGLRTWFKRKNWL